MTGRKTRGRRTTALTRGLMAEILLGTTIMVWSGSTTAGGRAAFGPEGSLIVVAITMVLLGVALGAVTFGARLGRQMRFLGVVAASLATVSLGAIAVTAMIDDPGIGIPLIFGSILIAPTWTQWTVALTPDGPSRTPIWPIPPTDRRQWACTSQPVRTE